VADTQTLEMGAKIPALNLIHWWKVRVPKNIQTFKVIFLVI